MKSMNNSFIHNKNHVQYVSKNISKDLNFCDKIQGHDDEIIEEFLKFLQPKSKTLATVDFRGLTLNLTPPLIRRGSQWKRNTRQTTTEGTRRGRREKDKLLRPKLWVK